MVGMVGMVAVTSVLRYVTSASRYQSRSSMYIRGLIPRNWLRHYPLEVTDSMSTIKCLIFAASKSGDFDWPTYFFIVLV